MKKFDKDEYKSMKESSLRATYHCIMCKFVTEDKEEMADHFYREHKKDFYIEED